MCACLGFWRDVSASHYLDSKSLNQPPLHKELQSHVPFKALLSDLEIKLSDETLRQVDGNSNVEKDDGPRSECGKMTAFVRESESTCMLKYPLKRLHFMQRDEGRAGGRGEGAGTGGEEKDTTAKRLRTEEFGS